nr:hypothetical protein [Tanacetum cinerariifolium]
ESSSSKPQDDYSADVPESSGISNPTATSTNPQLINWRHQQWKLSFPLLVHQF